MIKVAMSSGLAVLLILGGTLLVAKPSYANNPIGNLLNNVFGTNHSYQRDNYYNDRYYRQRAQERKRYRNNNIFSNRYQRRSSSNHGRYKRAAKRYNYKPLPRYAQKRKATGRNVFIFSPATKSFAAYDKNGNLVRSGRASGGSYRCSDNKNRRCLTPRGSFTVFSKKGPNYRSGKYPRPNGGAYMGHAMFFHKAGYAMHASNHVPPWNASHGCIRLQPHDARWLSQNLIKNGDQVIVRPYS